MANKVYYATNPLGGIQGSMDRIDGALLNDKDICVVVDLGTAKGSFYALDADSGLSEVPGPPATVVAPDNNAGTKRWILLNPEYADTSALLASLGIFDQVNTYNAMQYYAQQTIISSAGVATCDMDLEGYAKITLTEDVTNFTFTNFGGDPGKITNLLVVENVTGGHSITWDSMVDFSNESSTHNSAANAETLFYFFCNGTKLLAKKVWEST